jgi:site-specific DNA-methyltransferase (adenine-specific)
MSEYRLYNGDCLEVMGGLPDRSVDCVVCDLPYFGVVEFDFDNQWASLDEYLGWVEMLVAEYARLAKDNANVFLFTSRQYNRHICALLDRYFDERRIIVWCRKRGFNTTRGHALASGYEPICYYSRGEAVFNNLKIKPDTKRKEYTEGMLRDGICLSDVWSDIPALPHNSKERTSHPTQKPIALMERIVLLGSNEGDTVLDNCMGSGSTGVACVNTGRNFIGIEVDRHYFGVAEQRIRESERKCTEEQNRRKLW